MAKKWKDIKGLEGYYQVSQDGEIRSLDRLITYKNGQKRFFKSKVRKTYLDKCGYKFCTVSINGKAKNVRLHRILAECFIDNPQNKTQVNHKDGNKSNNSLNNLEWVTNSENVEHAYSIGKNYVSEKQKNLTSLANRGQKCSNSKLTEFDVQCIRDAYSTGVFTQNHLSNYFNVGQDQISRIVNYKRWAWL